MEYYLRNHEWCVITLKSLILHKMYCHKWSCLCSLFRFPVQDLTVRPLMQPHSGLSPSNVSYTPVGPKTTTGNAVLFMNCSPDVYKRSPTPPGSYRSPGSTPTVFGSSTGTSPHSSLPPLYDEPIFQSSMDSTHGKCLIPNMFYSVKVRKLA